MQKKIKINENQNLLKDLFCEKEEYIEKDFLFKKNDQNYENNFLPKNKKKKFKNLSEYEENIENEIFENIESKIYENISKIPENENKFQKINETENTENKIYQNSSKFQNISKIEKINESENIDISISNILQKFEIEENKIQNLSKIKPNENMSQNLTKIRSKQNSINIRDSHDTRNCNNFRLKKKNEKKFEKKFEKKNEKKNQKKFGKKKLMDLKINDVVVEIFGDDDCESIAKKYFGKIFMKNPGNFKITKLKNLIEKEVNREIERFLRKNKKLEIIKEKNIFRRDKSKVSYNDIRNLKKSKNDNFYKKLKKNHFEDNENGKTEDILNSFYEQIDRNKNEEKNLQNNFLKNKILEEDNEIDFIKKKKYKFI